MAVQAGLSLPWLQTPKTGFLVTRLNYPKILKHGFTIRVMHPVDVDGMANSVYPDQTDLGLHCLPRPVCP